MINAQIKLPGMDSGAFVVFAFATLLGSYLGTFLSKDISYKLNSELKR